MSRSPHLLPLLVNCSSCLEQSEDLLPSILQAPPDEEDWVAAEPGSRYSPLGQLCAGVCCWRCILSFVAALSVQIPARWHSECNYRQHMEYAPSPCISSEAGTQVDN